MTAVRTSLRGGRLLAAACLVVPLTATAAIYQAPLDKARWEVKRAPGSCRLSQSIPRFGTAVFEARAGAGQQFYLAPERPLSTGGTGQLVAAAPFWNPDRQPVELGAVEVAANRQPLRLADPLAQRLLQQLGDGMAPELRLAGPAAPLRIGVLPVYFRSAYNEYRACTARLSTVATRPVAAATAAAAGARGGKRVSFGANRILLDDASRAQLDRVVQRLSEDPAGSVVVEGHSSDSYRRMLNLELSRRRAEAVTDYLVERGVDRRRVTTRYFGERHAAVADRSVRHVDVRVQPAGKK